MELVKKTETLTFDTSLVREGDLIYVECSKWRAPKRGIVSRVDPGRITFLYHPAIANVTNMHTLSAEEAADEKLSTVIRWSSDLEDIKEYSAGEGS